MICILEVALLVWAIYVLAVGKLTLSKNRVVTGTPARLIALIGLIPLPLSLAVGVGYGVMMAQQGGNLEAIPIPLVIAEAVIAIGALILIFTIGSMIGRPPVAQARLDALLDEFDDEDDDDEPLPRSKPKPSRPDDRIQPQ